MAKKMKIVEEFKTFISRGNVLDLAVGIIIGTAFTAIVNSIVKDIFMPFVGWIMGGINFAELRIVIRQAGADSGELALTYGNFLQKVIEFFVIAVVVFFVVRTFNAFKSLNDKTTVEAEEPEVVEPTVSEDILLLTEIRDLLKKA